MTQAPGLTGRQPQAVRSALAVLDVVAKAGPGITAREITACLGLPRATTYRLISLLEGEEYLVRLPDLTGFALGARARHLAVDSAASQTVAEVLRSARSLALPGLAVHLARLGSAGAVVVDRDPCGGATAEDLVTSHPHASALGRLYLALGALALPPTLGRLTPRTQTDPRALSRELEQVRRSSLAVQLCELTEGTGCAASPVFGPGGVLVAAVVATGPEELLAPCLDTVGDLTRSTGRRLVGLLT